MLLEHTGRTSGLPRSTVLEVIRHDDASVDVAAAWGVKSDWYRNTRKHPAVLISAGRRSHQPAMASVVAPDEAAAVFADYATSHPKAAKALAKAFDLPLDAPQTMAETVPIVRLTLGAATATE